MQEGRKYHFFKMFMPLSFVALVTIIIICYIDTNNHINEVTSLVNSTVTNIETIFKRDISESVSDVLFLKKIIVNNYNNQLSKDEFINIISRTFIAFSTYHNSYSIIRFIDTDGQELLNVNNHNGKVGLVPHNELPNIKHRYYFAKFMALENNQLYLSPLDLNIFNNEIEIPFRPMIRIGTPIFSDDGKRLGIIVVNFNAQSLLDQLESAGASIPGDLFVIDKDGYFLLSNNNDHEWGNMLAERKDINAKNLYPKFWRKLNKDNPTEITNYKGIFLINYITSSLSILKQSDLNLKLIWFVPKSELIPSSIKYYLLLLLFIFISLIIVSWGWSRLKVKQAEYAKELELMATTDNLTGLANRHSLLKDGALEFERAKRFYHAFSVLLVDIDYFKKINDTFGHANGDKALTTLAKELTAQTRKIDIVARLGGEEFVIILPETTIHDANIVAEKLRKNVMHIKIPTKERSFSFTISIGISIWNQKDKDLKSTIDRADRYMYQAKENGRNQVCIESSE